MLRQRGRFFREQPSRPVLGRLFAAGFNFSRGNVIQDCPYDGRLHHLFFGEEASMAARLFVAGYDLYAPPESVCYHLWSREHRPTPAEAPWADPESVRRRKERSRALVREQLLAEDDRNPSDRPQHGGDRTASGFASAIGVDFVSQKVTRPAETEDLSSYLQPVVDMEGRSKTSEDSSFS